MSSRPDRQRSAQQRSRIAGLAARLIAEDGLSDLLLAKRKAVRTLGLPESVAMPDDRSVEAELRTYQDWYLRYAIQSIPGVAEVAGIGGFQKQYQVTIDPAKLQSFGLSIMEVTDAIRKSNNEVG